MKEPYGQGLATHPGPESCASDGNMAGEALTGVHAGQPLSSEIISPACRPCDVKGEGHTTERRQSQAAHGRCGVEDPAHAWKLFAREPGDHGGSHVARRGTVRQGLWPYFGHARFQRVGRSHSTTEADELRWIVIGRVRGGKGADQGKRRTNLTLAGLRAGAEWHRCGGRTRRIRRLVITRGKSRMR
jgi:hypothetical protein